MLYLDFSKAFDSVSHRLLIHKLQSFGFHAHLLNWFKAYLMGREQRVVVDSSNSDWLPVLSGVPQGSILGPMLFLCYINDMPSCTLNSTTALFADDSKCFRPIHSIVTELLFIIFIPRGDLTDLEIFPVFGDCQINKIHVNCDYVFSLCFPTHL